MIGMIDLHVHSTKSDGTLTPTELVDLAIKKNITAFALTDHDTVAGLCEAESYVRKLRNEGLKVPRFIPGIELSTEYDGKNVHIVGLFINYHCKEFTDYLENFISSRDERNKKMCEKLSSAGILISYEELLTECKGSVITRAHFAKLIVKKGYAKSKNEVFDRYIGDSCPYYVPRDKITPEMAISLIEKAGGVSIFAHPMLCKVGKERFEGMLQSMVRAGLKGIEAYYTTNTLGEQNQTIRIAEKYNLLLSGGSDFHGANKVGIDMGVGHGNLYVPKDCLGPIMKQTKKILFTDMDGTLLLSDSTISPSMKEGLDRLINNGHKLVLTSGRPLPSILDRIIKLGLNYPDTYAISYNGGLIYDVSNKKVIFSKKLSNSTVSEIMELAKKHGVHSHVYSDTHIISPKETEELKLYTNRITMPVIIDEDVTKYIDGSPKVQNISLKGREFLASLEKDVKARFSDEVEAVYSNDRFFEVLPKGVSKGNAVKFLSDYLCVDLSNTVACGDENNDISMLKMAGTAVTVKNGSLETKAAADIITHEDNNHDGLLEVINILFC